MMVVAMMLAAFVAMIERQPPVFLIAAVLAHATLPSGLLFVIVLGLAWFVMTRSWRVLAWTGAAIALCVLVTLLYEKVYVPHALPPGLSMDAGSESLLGRMRLLIFTDFARLAFLFIPCGFVPAGFLFFWKKQDAIACFATLVTGAMFLFFFVLATYSPHYFAPAMLLVLVPYWRWARTALATRVDRLACAVVGLALSLPPFHDVPDPFAKTRGVIQVHVDLDQLSTEDATSPVSRTSSRPRTSSSGSLTLPWEDVDPAKSLRGKRPPARAVCPVLSGGTRAPNASLGGPSRRERAAARISARRIPGRLVALRARRRAHRGIPGPRLSDRLPAPVVPRPARGAVPRVDGALGPLRPRSPGRLRPREMTEPRHPLWHALVFGLLAGALGAAWILKDFTRKGYALGYHVPLAIVFTTALVDVTSRRSTPAASASSTPPALAGAVIVGRMVEDWPLSGHGILGALLAVSPIRPDLPRRGVLVAIQALVTKLVLGEPWPAVVWGAAPRRGARLAGLVHGRPGQASYDPQADQQGSFDSRTSIPRLVLQGQPIRRDAKVVLGVTKRAFLDAPPELLRDGPAK